MKMKIKDKITQKIGERASRNMLKTVDQQDEYLKYLFSYIHLNPVKLMQSDWKESGIHDREAALAYLEKYKHSSFQDYDSVERIESAILNKEKFPEYFPTKERFRREIFDWMNFTAE